MTVHQTIFVPRDQGPHKAGLKCQWERPSQVAPEMLPLGQRHQAEGGGGNYAPPVNPDWDFYFAMERMGRCGVWTARTAPGALVGYVVWLKNRGMHAVDATFAVADLIYLAPEWRLGWPGYWFVRSAVDAAKRDMQPTIVHVETNELYESGRLRELLKRLGFAKKGEVWEL